MSTRSFHRRHVLQAATALCAVGVVGDLLPGGGGRARAADGAFRLSDSQWRSKLSPAQYDVLRAQGTEMPFSSPLDMFFGAGTYVCGGCGQPSYSSQTKFDSHTGWPSFWKPLPQAVSEHADSTLGMDRTEIHCTRCLSHLGHVFNDGPAPTGLRYCMNGVALGFLPAPGVTPPHQA